MQHDILDKIIKWAETEPEIRAVILEGSMASGSRTDELSDYDLNLFTGDYGKYSSGDGWIKKFDDILVYQKEKFFYKNIEIPTRLVIYQNSPRVDFSFWPVNILHDMADNKVLPEAYKNGYSVLLDKDNIAGKIIRPCRDGFKITRPEKDELLTAIYDFWFEACIIAKYLKRERLWFANVLENGPIKSIMLKIILWNKSGEHGWDYNGIHSGGKDLESHMDHETKKALSKCFSEYNKTGIWSSLFTMTDLFKRLSTELAEKTDVTYPHRVIGEIEKYIMSLYER